MFLKYLSTCAVQVLYWVNIASYRAIRPLCPAAAQARASSTGKDCNTNAADVWLHLFPEQRHLSVERDTSTSHIAGKTTQNIKLHKMYLLKDIVSYCDILHRCHQYCASTVSILSFLTMSLSWLCPECRACRTLWDSRISCLNLCLPKATAPLVTIIISLPWFCSMATWTATQPIRIYSHSWVHIYFFIFVFGFSILKIHL